MNPKQMAGQDILVYLKGWTSLKSSQTKEKVQGNCEETLINEYKVCAFSSHDKVSVKSRKEIDSML